LPDAVEVKELLETIRSKSKIPGIALSLSVGDRTLETSVGVLNIESCEPMTPGAGFGIGCMVKLFAAVITLEFAMEGRLDLDAPLEDMAPVLRGTHRGRVQRLRHLLCCATGYEESNTAALGPDLWAGIARARQVFSPGSVFSYEHTGYVLIGQILQQITGVDISSTIVERITDALGVGAGTVAMRVLDAIPAVVGHEFDGAAMRLRPAEVRIQPSTASRSNLRMRVGDMLTIARALMKAASAHIGNIGLNIHKHVESIHAPCYWLPKPIRGTGATGLPIAFGQGCGTFVHGEYGFNGGTEGQVCGLRFHPERQICLAVGINIPSPKGRDAIIDAVMEVLGWSPTSHVTECRGIYDFDLHMLIGAYRGLNGSRLAISAQKTKLLFSFSFSSDKTGLRVFVDFDQGTNTICLGGSGERLGLAVFLDPFDGSPCVALGVVMYKKLPQWSR
jgi:CubicO group peptidase (beta-lactamase class C family)